MQHIYKTTLLITILALTPACLSTKQPNDAFADLIAKRHSGYAYDPLRTVTKEQLNMLVKAAQSAPSSYNDQPWVFIVCDRTTNPQSYKKVFDALVEFNQKWAQNAPVLMVAVASENSHNGEFNRWAQYDTGAAAAFMVLQATQLGLMTHQMGGFDENKLRTAFNIPNDYVPMAVMAVGYEDQSKATKQAKKERKELKDNFFMGGFGSEFGWQ